MLKKKRFSMKKAEALKRKLDALCFLRSLEGMKETSCMSRDKAKRVKAYAVIAEANHILSS